MSEHIEIVGVDHIGIRVFDAARSEAFYAKLGFELVYSNAEAKVRILRNAQGVEINLIVNADASGEASNVLMDVPTKHTGYTHVALRVASVEATARALEALSIPISDGPVRLGNGVSLFVRDPDLNVIELRESPSSTS